MKNFFMFCAVLIVSNLSAQVGVNTVLPIKPLHIDGKKDNPAIGLPSADQAKNDVVVDEEGKVGIGILTPVAKLDVRGDVKIEGVLKLPNAPQLNVNDISPLFIDRQGKVGTAIVNNTTSLTYLDNIALLNSGTTFTNDFNAGRDIIIPFTNDDKRLNIDDIIDVEGTDLKVMKDGYYQLSLFINPFIQASSGNKIYFKSKISYKKTGENTWNLIVGIRPIIVAEGGSFYYPQVFPNTIVELKKGDLIRVTYTRSTLPTGAVQGDNVGLIHLDSNLGTLGLRTFQFSISKL